MQRKRRHQQQPHEQEQGGERESGVLTRVVYTQAPIQVAVLLGADGELWRVRLGGVERSVAADPSVDRALLESIARDGGRVLVDAQGEPIVIGALLTRRPLSIDANGDVDADVRRFTVKAAEQVMLQTKQAFLHLKGGRVELFAVRIVQRARERVRVLARQIGLN